MNDLPEITVPIGGYHVSEIPALVTTCLGSCVSVTMFDPVVKVGGLNHIVLPGTFLESDYQQMLEEEDSRYGIFSMEKLLYRMETFGANRKNLQVKIFGASLMGSSTSNPLCVQKENIDFVKAFLSMARLKIQQEVIFQEEALKITLNTLNGEVEITRIKNEFKKSLSNFKDSQKF